MVVGHEFFEEVSCRLRGVPPVLLGVFPGAGVAGVEGVEVLFPGDDVQIAEDHGEAGRGQVSRTGVVLGSQHGAGDP